MFEKIEKYNVQDDSTYFHYEITNDEIIDKLSEFLFKNIDKISKKESKPYVFNVDKVINDEIKIKLYFGKYKYVSDELENEPIYILIEKQGTPQGLDIKVDYYKRFLISCKKREILDKFIIQSIKFIKNKHKEDYITIYVTDDCGRWYLHNRIPYRTLNSIYVDDEIKDKILNDIDYFLKNEDEYCKFGIPYKRGYLLSGIPGSGKTSLIKSLCNKFNYNLSVISMSKKFDNDSLMSCISTLRNNTFLLLEDIDTIFEKRKSTRDNLGLTFSNLINVLDGVFYKHGCIIFMTTNHIEKLDEGLIREGRVDMILNFDYPTKINVNKAFDDILLNKKEEEFNKFYNFIKNQKISMSSIVNFLFRYKNTWEKNISELLKRNNFIREKLKLDNKNENFYT